MKKTLCLLTSVVFSLQGMTIHSQAAPLTFEQHGEISNLFSESMGRQKVEPFQLRRVINPFALSDSYLVSQVSDERALFVEVPPRVGDAEYRAQNLKSDRFILTRDKTVNLHLRIVTVAHLTTKGKLHSLTNNYFWKKNIHDPRDPYIPFKVGQYGGITKPAALADMLVKLQFGRPDVSRFELFHNRAYRTAGSVVVGLWKRIRGAKVFVI